MISSIAKTVTENTNQPKNHIKDNASLGEHPHYYSLSTQHKKNLLIHGFTRENAIDLTSEDVIDIIYKYYSHLIIWKIKGLELKLVAIKILFPVHNSK